VSRIRSVHHRNDIGSSPGISAGDGCLHRCCRLSRLGQKLPVAVTGLTGWPRPAAYLTVPLRNLYALAPENVPDVTQATHKVGARIARSRSARRQSDRDSARDWRPPVTLVAPPPARNQTPLSRRLPL